MAIGERTSFFRNLRDKIKKYLGIQIDFPEKTVDIHIAQYESDSNISKTDLTNKLTEEFGIST